ncbi:MULTISPECIES: non-oxidative hydroxyarylic acid decarboxylases subunit D [unclassified Adlercreutzia]|uniref:non-oxidative hydroxyarylic acid decarboxylases subunit D n=1 Tax=unclassified Adlercreutzia TaxID=2636013 RepID=UPI0013EDAA15|nr:MULTISPECIES: non-oxidative hydroxyarylic acid decarboxylases subunit D [unclassified Adlercreutzia]
MKCLRCGNDTAEKVADAPDGSGAWEVYACSTCHYNWRTSEQDYILDPAKRDPRFQMTNEDIAHLGRFV